MTFVKLHYPCCNCTVL